MTSLLSAARVLTSPPAGTRGPERRRYDADLTVLALALISGALAVIVGWALTEHGADPSTTAAPTAIASLGEPLSAAEPSPAYVELPREWRWHRAAVDFDAMYRTERDEEAASERPGWLRTQPQAPAAP